MKPSALSAVAALAVGSAAVSPVEVRQQQFVVADSGERFVIVGVDYQPGGQDAYGTGSGDPLSNATRCLRDAALMQALGINTLRSYNVDPAERHDECASIFNAVGIYLLIDVNAPLPGHSIDRSDPAASYTRDYLAHVFAVVDAFKDYPNILGFFAGNEIINDVATARANPPYIRAVQRDLKAYIQNHAARPIPVGYSAAQVQEVLHDTWAYLQCHNGDGEQDMSRSDFFGLNSYSWCGSDSSYTTSGYDTLVEWFGNTTIPVFFSEYGCNAPSPRVFEEVPVLYGEDMSVMSGGLVYEWTQEPSNYGIVVENDNGTLSLLSEYSTLMEQYNKLDIGLLTTSNQTATNLQPPKCSADLITSSDFSSDFDIPELPPGAAALIKDGVANGPTGSIVAVTQTSVQVPVYATNGARIANLAIVAASGANRPGSGSLTMGAADGGETASPTSSTSSGIAAKATYGAVGGAVAAGLFGAGLVM